MSPDDKIYLDNLSKKLTNLLEIVLNKNRVKYFT